MFVVCLFVLSIEAGQNSPIFNPTKIFVTKTDASEGESLVIKCRITKFKISLDKDSNMYLCKDGQAINIQPLTSSPEVIFTLDNVTHKDSGNYSCVYLNRKVQISEVKATGNSAVFIRVNSKTEPCTVCIYQILNSNEGINSRNFIYLYFFLASNSLWTFKHLFLVAGLLALASFLGVFYICCRKSCRQCKYSDQL